MNILFLADIVPYPPNTGIKIRTYNILKQLHDNGNNKVFVLCFNHKTLISSPQDLTDAVAALKLYCEEIRVFDIASDRSLLAKYFSMMKNIFQRVPHRCIRYFSQECQSAIKSIVRDVDIDIVHLDKTELAYYLDDFRGIPVVCTNHNVESKLMASRVVYERGVFRKYFAHIQSKKLRKFEKKILNSIDGYVTCTDVDRDYFESEMAIDNRQITIANGVDINYYQRKEREGEFLLIVGAQNVDSTANFDATHWFMSSIWPGIKSFRPEVKLKIVGRNPDKTILNYATDNDVEIVGFVDDERDYFNSATALIVPIRVGGGSRLKILVGMAMGLPIVSTAVGAEGIDVVDGQSITLADEVDQFVDAVVRTISDGGYRGTLAKNAREIAENEYDWSILGRRLRAFYQQIIKDRLEN